MPLIHKTLWLVKEEVVVVGGGGGLNIIFLSYKYLLYLGWVVGGGGGGVKIL